MALAHELANIQFAMPAHFRRARIARDESYEPRPRLLAEGPRYLISASRVSNMCWSRRFQEDTRTPKHGSVVALGVLHNARILFGYEKFAGLHMAFAARRVSRSTAEFLPMTDDLVFAILCLGQNLRRIHTLGYFRQSFQNTNSDSALV